MKSYQQYCPVATGLDHLGDRWTLLILRDLAWYGPARFTDLATHNHGLPPALLSERLARLVDDGLVEHLESGAYGLTERGSGVRPVIDAIASFGAGFLPDEQVTRQRLGYMTRRLSSLYSSDLGDVEPVSIDLMVDNTTFGVTISPDGIELSDATGSELALETDREGLFGLLTGTRELETMNVRGDSRTMSEALRFLRPVAT